MMARSRKFSPLKAMPNGRASSTQSHVTRGEPFAEYATKRRPFARNAANARERCRMRVLSKAFCRLKTCLPWVPPDTKLSKLDTLRLASSYIAHLRALLTDDNDDADQKEQGQRSSSLTVAAHPSCMSWPYSAVTSLQEQQRRSSSSNSTGASAQGESSSESSGEYSVPSTSAITQQHFNRYPEVTSAPVQHHQHHPQYLMSGQTQPYHLYTEPINAMDGGNFAYRNYCAY